MPQTFTSNDLVRYLYKETSRAESVAIKEAIEEDYQLRQEFEELQHGYQFLPKVKFRPTHGSIQAILNYSAATALEKQF